MRGEKDKGREGERREEKGREGKRREVGKKCGGGMGGMGWMICFVLF